MNSRPPKGGGTMCDASVDYESLPAANAGASSVFCSASCAAAEPVAGPAPAARFTGRVTPGAITEKMLE